MKAAYRLPWLEGMAKLKKQAQWLETHYPGAAASLREGLEEIFIINRLELPATLRRCILGYRDLWILKAKLENKVALDPKQKLCIGNVCWFPENLRADLTHVNRYVNKNLCPGRLSITVKLSGSG
jgi:hypothetical protein